MRGIFGLFIATLCLFYAVQGFSASVNHNQIQTILALKSYNKGHIEQSNAKIIEINDPFSTKLYDWTRFSDKNFLKNGNKHELIQIKEFVRHNPSWPRINAMKQIIESQMPDDTPAKSIIEWFDEHKPHSVRGVDMYLQALKDTGQIQKMQEFLQNWWAKTPLSRKDQISLFKKYKSYLTRSAHEKRLDTLLFSKQYTNARAVASVLKRGYPQLTEARIALAANKRDVNDFIKKVPQHLLSDTGLEYERLKWRRQNNLTMRAIQILQAPIDASKITNPKSWWRERHIIIRRLLETKQYESAYLLASHHIQKEGLTFAQAEWMAGWLSLQFLNAPRRAFQHFETLYNSVESPISKARAAYWGGRAAAALGRSDVSKPWYNAASQFQITFYGQLAAKELAMGGNLQHVPPPILSVQDIRRLNNNELVRAIRIFHAGKMKNETKQFLSAYSQTLKTAKEYKFAAELSAEIGHYDYGIKIAKIATKKGMFLTAQSYPLITNRLQNVGLEWSLIHALIRQESAFDIDAKSTAGARGLMQLMPATAKEVAQQNGIPHRYDWLSTRPNHNIQLGSLYLSKMLRRFDGHYPMAIAAYNAGPNRVDQWIKRYGDPRKGEIDPIDWIELIPIYETRNYVQRVMEATYIYRLRLRGKEPDLPKGLLHTKT